MGNIKKYKLKTTIMKSFICILLIISLARSVELLDKRVL